MSASVIKLLLFCYLTLSANARLKKFIIRKELTEHCRRGVPLSVFLGTHVTEASSQILQFSKAVLPYNCFIAARTEAGNNIILVMQDMDDDQLQRICAGDAKQVIVYEMMDSFGGYWGQVPDFIRSPRPLPSNVYTIETTTVSATEEEETEESSVSIETTSVTEAPTAQTRRDDDLVIEIPIVNISGNFIHPLNSLRDIFNVRASNRGGSTSFGQYITSMYSLLEFSEMTEQFPQFAIDYSINPFYQSYPTNSLTSRSNFGRRKFWHTFSKTTGFRVTRRSTVKYTPEKTINDRVHSSPLAKSNSGHFKSQPTTKLTSGRSRLNIFDPRFHTSHSKRISQPISNPRLSEKRTSLKFESFNTFWTAKKDFLKTLLIKSPSGNHVMEMENKTEHLKSITKKESVITTSNVFKSGKKTNTLNSEIPTGTTKFKINKLQTEKYTPSISYQDNSTFNVTQSLESKANADHPYKVDTNRVSLLTQSLTLNVTAVQNIFNTSGTAEAADKSIILITKEKGNATTIFPDKEISDILANSNRRKIENDKGADTISTSALVMILDNPEELTSILNIQTSSTPAVTLLNRETWENIVLAAPKMARVLNHSSLEADTTLDIDPDLERVTLLNKSKRDKRYLQGISVYDMLPRALTSSVTPESINENEYRYLEFDVEDFGKNIERLNDQAQERTALRYPNKFLGRELFNLCEHKDKQSRHIFMFNSSRVWIQLSNFSLDSISIVLTEARRVIGTDTSCDTGYLECQLGGSRVCIDALNACDGVPNCGAYDIYDEDRLRCGYTQGMQQSVYVAAFAFLILVHIIIYIIMYWLKRCVPKVSKAFFIYTEGAENMLNLQTIMKSPLYDESPGLFDMDQNFAGLIPTTIYNTQEKKVDKVSGILQSALRFLTKKFERRERFGKSEDKDQTALRLRRTDSLNDFNLFGLSKDFEETGIQTSLEMDTIFNQPSGIEVNESNELKILKFCRVAKTDCTCKVSNSKQDWSLTELAKKRKELSLENQASGRRNEDINVQRPSNVLQDRQTTRSFFSSDSPTLSVRKQESRDSVLITTTADIHNDKFLMPQRGGDKKLRFDEIAIAIKNSEDQKNGNYSAVKLNNHEVDLDKIEQAESAYTGKQYKKFWLPKKKPKQTMSTMNSRQRK